MTVLEANLVFGRAEKLRLAGAVGTLKQGDGVVRAKVSVMAAAGKRKE